MISRFIFMVGEGEKMPAAIIQPNFEFVTAWAKRHDIAFNSNEELICNQQVLDRKSVV